MKIVVWGLSLQKLTAAAFAPVIFFCTVSAFAQTTVRQQTQTQLQPIAQDPSVILDYMATTDLLDKASPRLYNHYAAAQYTHSFNEKWSVGLGLQATYTSLNNKIVETERGFAEVLPSGNFDVVYNFQPGFISSFLRAGAIIPVDEYSRYEGYRAIPYVGFALSKPILSNRVSLNHLTNLRYLVNEVDKSSSGIANPTYSISLLPRMNVTLIENLFLSVGFGFKWTRLADGNSDYSYFNKQSLIYQWNSTSLILSHMNGGFTEDGNVYLWFIDRNRKMISAGVSYAF